MGSHDPATGGGTPGGGRRIILDGCALLNLYASRRIAEILSAMPRPTAVPDYIRDHEALWVGRRKAGPEADIERVEIHSLVLSGVLEVLTLSGDKEMAHFLALASSSRLDDGEAICGAIAQSRGLIVVTDDRAALNVFGRQSPPIQTCSTASLLKHWTSQMAVDATTLRCALTDIRERASFEPSSRDPLQGWWQASLNPS